MKKDYIFDLYNYLVTKARQVLKISISKMRKLKLKELACMIRLVMGELEIGLKPSDFRFIQYSSITTCKNQS